MNVLTIVKDKIKSLEEWASVVETWKEQGETLVFTNGCFDLLHYGHLHYLAEARNLGHKLIVGLNSDASVTRLKGPQRPIQEERSRCFALASLQAVDGVVVFEQDTPLHVIQTLLPNILVKGGDYVPETIVGADVVLAHGGQVLCLPFVAGYSTTAIEQKIRQTNTI